MNTPETEPLSALLPDWNIQETHYGLQITSQCGRVHARLARENLVFGKGRGAIRKTEWVLRIEGRPGFDGIGNESYPYFATALEQAVVSADAREKRDAEEADALNQGEIPWEGVSKVTRPKGKVHFFSKCRGSEPRRIAYAVQDTTCLHCLYARATRLKGFRWTHEHNTEEVAFLKSKLGSKVDGFDAEQPGDDHLRETLKWLEQ